MRAMTMAMLLGLGAAATAPRPAAAPAIHRCVGIDGGISYQSAPCSPGMRQDWVRPLPAASPSASTATPASRRAASPSAATARSRAPSSRPVSRAPGRAAASSRCESARRDADATRERLWNRLGFRERSELDAGVARACAR